MQRGGAMVYAAAILFVAAGIVMLLRRVEIARGQSMLWGGTMVPGCIVLQAIMMMLIGAAFVVFDSIGLLG